MKTNVRRMSLLLSLVMLAAQLASGRPSQTAAQATADQTTSFTVGEGPEALTFDGANIWVANSNSGTVSKL